jgi:hypothetical protein
MLFESHATTRPIPFASSSFNGSTDSNNNKKRALSEPQYFGSSLKKQSLRVPPNFYMGEMPELNLPPTPVLNSPIPVFTIDSRSAADIDEVQPRSLINNASADPYSSSARRSHKYAASCPEDLNYLQQLEKDRANSALSFNGGDGSLPPTTGSSITAFGIMEAARSPLDDELDFIEREGLEFDEDLDEEMTFDFER